MRFPPQPSRSARRAPRGGFHAISSNRTQPGEIERSEQSAQNKQGTSALPLVRRKKCTGECHAPLHSFRVAEKGSFSAVAKERGIGQPAVSKQISALEDELGTELIHRNSRSVSLTEAGLDFYESASRILDDVENATSRIGRAQTSPKGLIRLTVPPTFARLHMVSKLPAFFAAYPDLAVEMGASESPTTIIEDGFDLAIHSGDLPDSSLVARKFAQTMIILVATPQYVMRYGMPQSPEDLRRYPAVVFIEHGSPQPWSIGSVKTGQYWVHAGIFS